MISYLSEEDERRSANGMFGAVKVFVADNSEP